MSNTVRKAIDLYAEYTGHKILVADGFDDAIVGLSEARFEQPPRVCYCKTKMVQVLMKRDKMDYGEALEYLEFNTWGAYVGPETPMWLETLPALNMYLDDLVPSRPAPVRASQKPRSKPGQGKTHPHQSKRLLTEPRTTLNPRKPSKPSKHS